MNANAIAVSDGWQLVLILSGVGFAIVALILDFRWVDKQRTGAMRAVAADLGLEFSTATSPVFADVRPESGQRDRSARIVPLRFASLFLAAKRNLRRNSSAHVRLPSGPALQAGTNPRADE